MKSLPKWVAAVLLTAPLGARALGLGDIELQSALNQPFRAEIELLSVTAEELEGLRVGLAGSETFARYGLERTADLNALEFEIGRSAAGRDVVRVISRRPIGDPFLTMLVEATWPRGRLLREYTVLLDPPLFTPDLGAEPPIRQAAAGGAPVSDGGPIARPPVGAPSSGAASTAPASSAAASTSARGQASMPSSNGATAAEYGPVRSGETLWGIASRLRPADVTINQMMVGLYDANPGAFDANMNLLLRGATLRIPERARLVSTSPEAATAVARRHEADWAGGGSALPAGAGEGPQQQARLRLLPPSAEEGQGEAAETAPSLGPGSPAAAETAEAVAAASVEIARLEAEVSALQGELEESHRLLQLRDEELLTLQRQLSTSAESSAAEPGSPVVPGVDLEGEQIFAEEAPADEATPVLADEEPNSPAAEPSAAGEPAVADAQGSIESPPDAAADASVAAAPMAGPPPARSGPATSARPSLLSRVLGWVSSPLLLIGLGLGAVLLTAVWYLRHRREDVEDVTGRWDALEAEVQEETLVATARLKRKRHDDTLVVEEEPRGGTAEIASVDAAGLEQASRRGASTPGAIEDGQPGQGVIELDQGDALAEADFHMAYGLYDQAAELVVKALESEPERRDLKLKLLEVYFVWGNKDAFRDAARDFKVELGEQVDPDWDKVLIMGKQICPDDPMFAESAAGGDLDLDLAATGASTELDFALDGENDASAGIDPSLGADSGSFELGLVDTVEQTGSARGDAEEEWPDLPAFDAGEQDEGSTRMRRADDENAISLDIGERTAAGLEAALFEDDEEEQAAAATSAEDAGGELSASTDVDPLAVTQESPTLETPRSELDEDEWFGVLGDSVATVETPTVEAAGPEAPTIETPTIETAGPEAPTMETPTIEASFGGTERMVELGAQTGEAYGSEPETAAAEHTEEIDLDDLGLSVEDLDGLPSDAGELRDGEGSDTREQPALTADEALLSATGMTAILEDTATEEDGLDGGASRLSSLPDLEAEDATLLVHGFDEDFTVSRTEVMSSGPDGEAGEAGDSGEDLAASLFAEADENAGATSLVRALGDDEFRATGSAEGDGPDLDLDDFGAVLSGGDTVEQARSSSFESELFGDAGATPVDLDVGYEAPADDEPTGTEEIGGLDALTLTEVGTKLDLARAYIDMGDPEGARGILEEVLDEGDAGQRREAQELIDRLTA